MLDYPFSPELQSVVELSRQVAREVIAPRAAQVDEQGTYPQDYFNVFRETGLLGLAIPEAYGGSGLGTLGLVLAVEEVTKYCCTAGLMLLLTRLPTFAMVQAGTEAQRQQYVAGVASGELRGSFCLSEPDVGSDVQRLTTRAVKRGGKYYITGTKNWISGAGEADFFIVAAKTDPDAKGTRGFSVFVVDRNTPGLTVGKKEKKLGVRGLGVHQVIFDEAEVSEANLIGVENEGFKLIMHNLNAVRPVVAARGLGLAQGALTNWLAYSRERHTFGKQLIEHQGLQWMAAEMAVEIEAARLLTYRAAHSVDQKNFDKDSAHILSMAKLKASETAVRVANECLQMAGAVGYMEDYPFARYVRDARQLTIVEGTSQIQKNIIGGALQSGALQW